MDLSWPRQDGASQKMVLTGKLSWHCWPWFGMDSYHFGPQLNWWKASIWYLNSNQNDVTTYQWYANRMLTKLIVVNPDQPIQPYISSLSTRPVYLQHTNLASTCENHNALQYLLYTIVGRRCSGRCAREQCGIWARSHVKAAKQKKLQKITF